MGHGKGLQINEGKNQINNNNEISTKFLVIEYFNQDILIYNLPIMLKSRSRSIIA